MLKATRDTRIIQNTRAIFFEVIPLEINYYHDLLHHISIIRDCWKFLTGSYEEYIIKRKASQKEIFRTTEPHIPGCVLCHFSRSYWVSRVPESSYVPKARGAFEHRQRHKGADCGFGTAKARLAGGDLLRGEGVGPRKNM